MWVVECLGGRGRKGREGRFICIIETVMGEGMVLLFRALWSVEGEDNAALPETRRFVCVANGGERTKVSK